MTPSSFKILNTLMAFRKVVDFIKRDGEGVVGTC